MSVIPRKGTHIPSVCPDFLKEIPDPPWGKLTSLSAQVDLINLINLDEKNHSLLFLW